MDLQTIKEKIEMVEILKQQKQLENGGINIKAEGIEIEKNRKRSINKKARREQKRKERIEKKGR